MKFAFLLLIASAVAASAEEAEWKNLYGCLEKHKSDVASVVEGIDEGAGLIVEVLCVEESTEVVNAMVRARIGKAMEAADFGEKFTSFLYVVKREMREHIYLEKLRQR